MKRKIVKIAIITVIGWVSICQAGSVMIPKGKNDTVRTETRHRYEWQPGDRNERGRWELKSDHIFVIERDRDNSRKDKKEGR